MVHPDVGHVWRTRLVRSKKTRLVRLAFLVGSSWIHEVRRNILRRANSFEPTDLIMISTGETPAAALTVNHDIHELEPRPLLHTEVSSKEMSASSAQQQKPHTIPRHGLNRWIFSTARGLLRHESWQVPRPPSVACRRVEYMGLEEIGSSVRRVSAVRTLPFEGSAHICHGSGVNIACGRVTVMVGRFEECFKKSIYFPLAAPILYFLNRLPCTLQDRAEILQQSIDRFGGFPYLLEDSPTLSNT